ncbi:MAG: glycerol-3-phosphate dehydrogenase [Rudaea sp.]
MNAKVAGGSIDVLVVGGGINGAAIARDAAGRGLSVLLCEKDDLAGHTSSASSKLIHGGLRYLEQYEFSLVGKALAEREVVLRSAPHIVRPLRFVLPHEPHLRPEWMIRAALLLYDNLGRRRAHSLIHSRRVDLRQHVAGPALLPQFRKGFIYSDAWADDARLVVLIAKDAAMRGATILTRTRCERAQRTTDRWHVRLREADGRERLVETRALVNAAGPWAASFLGEVARIDKRRALRLIKGSHIVVPRLFAHEHAYTFQQDDRRIVFAIPYERDFTLIGTTDVEFDGDSNAVQISDEEKRYLCAASNRYFRRKVSPEDIVWSYSGVRPLLDDESSDASEVTRDYLLDRDDTQGAPLLSVFGGKITTHRKLAEEAVDWLAPLLGNDAAAWTADGATLPGGDFSRNDDDAGFDRFLHGVVRRYPWLPCGQALRYARSYGSCIERMLGAATGMADLGPALGADLHACEVDYLVREEWARTTDDVLWRRSKLGLRFDAASVERLDEYLRSKPCTAT